MAAQMRVLIAEDHTILRDGLKSLLASTDDLEVIGEAMDGREAIRKAETLNPDLVMLDLTMPRMNGLEAIAEIRRVSPATRILVLTVHRAEEYVFAALREGADGYVLKDASSSELLLAARRILSGHRYLSPEISGSVIEGYLTGRASDATPQSALEQLSQREREVLKLVAEGFRNREISDFLCISPKTVEKHRGNLMRKLDLHTVAALTAFALEKGIIDR